MTKDELIVRLKGYEWADFECKKAKRDVPKDAYPTVSAFANTAGGWLLFGISENPRHLKPVYLNGNPWDSYIRRGARDERVTDNELQRLLRDSATQSWDAECLPDFDVGSALDVETVGWYQSQFYRRNPEQRQIDDPVEFLREWNFILDQAGQSQPTRAAVLLFGADRSVRRLLPRPVLDYQRIDTGYEQWDAYERWHDRVVFEENLFKTWRGLVGKYSRMADHPFRVDPATMRRNDDPPDYVAFREAAINLLIHQDYGDHHRKASLKWFTDQTLFWNPGDAFATTDELLASTEKDIRNPLLVNAFRRIGLSDQAGTGIRAIYRNWHELGHRYPQINNDKAAKSFELILNKAPLLTGAIQRFQSSLGVHLTAEQAEVLALATERRYLQTVEAAMAVGGNLRAAHRALEHLTRQQLLQKLDDNSYALSDPIRARLDAADKIQAVEETAGQVIPEVTGEVTGEVLKLISAVEGEMKRAELQQKMGLKHEDHFREAYLLPGLEAGVIEMTIPDKPRSSKQRYRLTETGRRVVQSSRSKVQSRGDQDGDD